MKMRAAVLHEFGQPLSVQEVDLAPPKAGEVLVKVLSCGVCHTDMYTASGADPSGYCPCVLGHEGAGVVEEVGPDVTDVAVGDHVVTLFSPECGRCDHCRSGKTNICTAIRAMQGQGYLPDGTPRLSHEGEGELRHFMGTSTFAEYTVMPEVALAKIDQSASLDSVCLLACGATTGLAAALWKAEVEEGSTVAVFGAGLVGLGAVIGARLRGAEKIFLIDPSEKRRALGEPHGATHLLPGGDDAVQQVLDLTDGMGADYTFEATGLVSVMGQAVEAARMGWGVCTVLGVAGKGEKLEVVPRFLITGRTVQGGSFGGARGRTQVPQLVDMYLDGQIDLDSLVSHRIPLDRVNHAFDLMEAQDGIRSVIQMHR
ncbi:MAG: alcohol dehydrogenase catalytic domain-containing protein [Acidobacteriota bacterium]